MSQKTLAELTSNLSVVHRQSDLDMPIPNVHYDSRSVTAGSLFVALRGAAADGHQFINEAVGHGAQALVVEDRKFLPNSIPGVVVKDTRLALAKIAAEFYDHPSRNLQVVGVTGTNGKTTVAFLIDFLLQQAGINVGLLGTVHYRLGDKVIPSVMTTPESLDFQRLLSDMRREGVTHVVCEVSSHALSQGRCEEVHFDQGIFTNLSRDHLEYHGSLESYFSVKQRLFDVYLRRSVKPNPVAIVNFDDPYGQRLIQKKDFPLRTYSIETDRADYFGQIQECTNEGVKAVIHTPTAKVQLQTSLLGKYNLSNCLAALIACEHYEIAGDFLCGALAKFDGVPGRLQSVPNAQGKTVLIDYAHTPDALENVLNAVKAIVPKGGRLCCVFGCGGDRDSGKRPLMGQVAAQVSDQVWITSDNPRTEDPQEIIEQIQAGIVAGTSQVRVEVDRAKAIQNAIQALQRQDVLIIAGKGHEKFQIIGSAKNPFDDFSEAKKVLESQG